MRATRYHWLNRGVILLALLFGSRHEIFAQSLLSRESLTPEEARSLAAKYHSHKSFLTLSHLKELDPDVAKELAVTNGELSFSALQTLSPEAARELASHKGMLKLDALVELPPETAKVLVKHGGALSLKAAPLSDETLSVLSEYPGLLVLGLITVSEDQARILAEHEGRLQLPSLQALGNHRTEEILSQHRGDLRMDSLASLTSAALAAKLAAPDGHLSLLLLSAVPNDCLEELVRHKGTLDIGLTELTPAQARILIQHPGALWLNRIRALTDECSTILQTHSDDLMLSSLQTLDDPKLAAKLASGKPAFLSLNGLKTLNPDVARTLVAANCPLLLKKLTSVSPELATEFAAHKSSLDLAGVTSMTPEVAQILVRHEKRLVLTGLSDASSEVLAILKKNKAIQLPRPANL